MTIRTNHPMFLHRKWRVHLFVGPKMSKQRNLCLSPSHLDPSFHSNYLWMIFLLSSMNYSCVSYWITLVGFKMWCPAIALWILRGRSNQGEQGDAAGGMGRTRRVSDVFPVLLGTCSYLLIVMYIQVSDFGSIRGYQWLLMDWRATDVWSNGDASF